MNKKNVDGFDLTFSAEWTQKIESREHWGYYWRQASLVEQHVAKNDKILEIGVGSGFLQNYLKSRDWPTFSIDIDGDKGPDFVSDASTFNFKEISPDCLLAFEIFEHIPFPLFSRTISNISKSQPSVIIFSLPVSVYYIIDFKLKIPKFGLFDIKIPFPKFNIKVPNHFWELSLLDSSNPRTVEGKAKGIVSIKEVKKVFGKSGYFVEQVEKEGKINFFIARRINDKI